MTAFSFNNENKIEDFGEKTFSTGFGQLATRPINNGVMYAEENELKMNRIKCYPLYPRDEKNFTVCKIEAKKPLKCEYSADMINYSYILQKMNELEFRLNNKADASLISEMKRGIYACSKQALTREKRQILNDYFVTIIKYNID